MSRHVFANAESATVRAELAVWAAPTPQASARQLIDALGGQRAVLAQLGYDGPSAAGYRSAQRNLQRYAKEDGQSRTATGAFGARLRELAERQGIDVRGDALKRHGRRNIRRMAVSVTGYIEVGAYVRNAPRTVTVEIEAGDRLDALADPVAAWADTFSSITGQDCRCAEDEAFFLSVEVEADDD